MRSFLACCLLSIAAIVVIVHSSADSLAQTKGAWTAKAPAPTKRTEVVAAAVNSKIYVIGGFVRGLSVVSAAVEEYDPTTDRWRERASLPSGVHHAGIAVVNGRLYIVGGFE